MKQRSVGYGTFLTPCGSPEAQKVLHLVGKVPTHRILKWIERAKGTVAPAPTQIIHQDSQSLITPLHLTATSVLLQNIACLCCTMCCMRTRLVQISRRTTSFADSPSQEHAGNLTSLLLRWECKNGISANIRLPLAFTSSVYVGGSNELAACLCTIGCS